MIMGFIIHFYITFGTNLLIGGPAHIAVLLPVSVFRRNGMKPSAALFLGRISSWRLGVHVRRSSRRPGDRGAPPYWACPLSRGPLGRPPTYFFLLYKPTYPENIQEHPKHNFHRRNLLYPQDPILEPSSVFCRMGNPPWGASTSTSLPLR